MAQDQYRIETDSPAGADLKFWSLIGHEALSRPSVYELTVLSDKPDIQATDILGRSFDVVLGFDDAEGAHHERHCQGVAVRFARRHALGRYHEYRIELRSWFWLLTKRRNSRILSDDATDPDAGESKTVLEIIDIVLENSPIRAIKQLKSEGGLLNKHEARGYCVQFEETDYAFLSRLLEDEGIYYWFDAHAEPGTMRLGDSSHAVHDPLPVADGVLRHAPGGISEARFNEIWHWESERKLDTGWFASADVHYKKIHTKLGAAGGDLEEHELKDFEEFEYPGGYLDAKASELVRDNRMDELRARRLRHWALTQWSDVAPGRSFRYEGDPDGSRDGEYLIGGCIVVAVHPGYESVPRLPADPQAVARALNRVLEGDAVNGDAGDTLRRLIDSHPALRELQPGMRSFLITTWPLAQSYKPPRLTPRVRMPGPQTAIVVGPKGEEFPLESGEDLYVDKMGRVKVWFHWNRYDKDKKDLDGQKWSAWLRVSQPWAGKKWGGYFAPRIGQEVIVDFLNGDPDRPLIVGRVYNDDQEIPYTSPTQSGFKTRSTPKGEPKNYNEIMFEDRKGHENLNIHAERNMSRSVEADDSTSVGHDQSITVENDRTDTVKGHETTAVLKNQTNTVVGFQDNTVEKNQDNYILGYQTTRVGKDQALLVTGNIKLHTDADRIDEVLGSETHTVIGKITQTSKELEIGTTTSTSLSSGTTMTLASTGDMTQATDANYVAYAKSNVNVGSGTANIGLAAPAGNIDLMAVKVNLLATGPSSTYTNAAKDSFALGIFSKTVVGAYNETSLAAQLKTTIGIVLETKLALNLSNVTMKLENTFGSMEKGALKSFFTGGSGGATGAVASMAEMGPLASFVFGMGIGGTLGSVAIGAAQAWNFSNERDKALSDKAIDAQNKRISEARAAATRLAAQAKLAGRPALAQRLEALADTRQGILMAPIVITASPTPGGGAADEPFTP